MNIRELYRKYELLSGKMVQIEGWIRTNRASKAFGFLEVNDGTFFRSVQVVYEEAFLENFVEISKLLTASAIAVQGVVELTPEGRQPFDPILCRRSAIPWNSSEKSHICAREAIHFPLYSG